MKKQILFWLMIAIGNSCCGAEERNAARVSAILKVDSHAGYLFRLINNLNQGSAKTRASLGRVAQSRGIRCRQSFENRDCNDESVAIGSINISRTYKGLVDIVSDVTISKDTHNNRGAYCIGRTTFPGIDISVSKMGEVREIAVVVRYRASIAVPLFKALLEHGDKAAQESVDTEESAD